MPFVTKLTLESGNRPLLEDVVNTIKETAARKGVELKGPHPHPPDERSVPQSARLGADDDRRFDPWQYTVYTRTIEIVGHDTFARSVAERDFPDDVHVSAEIEQQRQMG
jgi:ribosomal protein S10